VSWLPWVGVTIASGGSHKPMGENCESGGMQLAASESIFEFATQLFHGCC